jgi:undecaprenyl-diphosphatase
MILAVAVPAMVGYHLESRIDRRLSRPVPMAAGLAAGGLLMAAADFADASARGARDFRVGDGVALGVAQALALAPGVSRRGATVAAARVRGFDAAAADELSWQVGVPVMIGAGALKVGRALAAGRRPWAGGPVLVGAAAAFGSTLGSARVGSRRDGRRRLGVTGTLRPFAAYRVALAALVLWRASRTRPAPHARPTGSGPGEEPGRRGPGEGLG